MQNIKVDKTKLIGILKDNLKTHTDEYNEALSGYHTEVIKQLTEALNKAVDGVEYITTIDLNKPITNTESYETVIGMLELDTSDFIELSEIEYRRYVQDKWEWSQIAKLVNSTYLGK